LQIGEFLVLLLEVDRRRPGCFSCVTVINGASWKTWEAAYERGWVAVAPPPPQPLVWTATQLEELRRRAWVRALDGVSAERPPEVSGMWLSQARRRTRSARDAFLQEQQRRVRATYDQIVAGVQAEHERDLAALDHWQHVAAPAYQDQLRCASAANLA